jgi:hypothetical protein
LIKNHDKKWNFQTDHPTYDPFFEKCGESSEEMKLDDTLPELDYFNLFFMPYLLAIIVYETNKYALDQLSKISKIELKDKLLKKWYPITVQELTCFIGKFNLKINTLRNLLIFWFGKITKLGILFSKRCTWSSLF